MHVKYTVTSAALLEGGRLQTNWLMMFFRLGGTFGGVVFVINFFIRLPHSFSAFAFYASLYLLGGLAFGVTMTLALYFVSPP